MDQEIWKDIKGFEGYYQVSNHGRIKALERIVGAPCGRTAIKKEKIRKPVWNPQNNCYSILLVVGNIKKHYRLDRLVANAFLAANPNYKHIRYIDGDKSNNRFNNLQFAPNPCQKLK